MKKFKNLMYLIPQFSLNKYRTHLLKLATGDNVQERTIDGVEYYIEWESDCGKIALLNGEDINHEQLLKYDMWLFDQYDRDQVELTKALQSEYAHYLEATDLDIHDYINLLIDLQRYVVENINIDVPCVTFNDCTIPYVRDVMTLLNNIDYESIVDRTHRTQGFTLYRNSHTPSVDCTINEMGVIEFIDTYTGFKMIPSPMMYGDEMQGVQLIGIGYPKSVTYQSFDRIYGICLMVNVLAAIRHLRSKPYLFT